MTSVRRLLRGALLLLAVAGTGTAASAGELAFGAAMEALQRGEPGSALALLEKEAASDPQSIRNVYWLGVAQERSGKSALAFASYRRVLGLARTTLRDRELVNDAFAAAGALCAPVETVWLQVQELERAVASAESEADARRLRAAVAALRDYVAQAEITPRALGKPAAAPAAMPAISLPAPANPN